MEYFTETSNNIDNKPKLTKLGISLIAVTGI